MARDPRSSKHPVQGKHAPTKMVPAADQCRCSCGSLLARVVAEGLELKCRKCKSLVLIRHEELVEMYQRLGLRPAPRVPIGMIPPR